MSGRMSADDGFSEGRDLRSTWSWFVALGLGFVAFSVVLFANLNAVNSTTVDLAASLMVAAAAAQAVPSFRARKWSGFPSWFFSALAYGVAGALMFSQANAPSSFVHIMVGVVLLSSAAGRIWSSLEFRSGLGAVWISLSGATTIGTSLVVTFAWPFQPSSLLGLAIAIDLFIQGLAALLVGLTLRGAQDSPSMLEGAFAIAAH